MKAVKKKQARVRLRGTQGQKRRYRFSPAARKLPPDQLEKVRRVLADDIFFVPDPLFKSRRAEREIFGPSPVLDAREVPVYRVIHPELADEKTVTPKSAKLTTDQERTLFLRLNYARYRLQKIQRGLRGRVMGLAVAKDCFIWVRREEQTREMIAASNLPLVLAMAKRTRLRGAEFSEAVSEGNMALLRAMDKFDCARGFKFSTYACRAILKSFSRHASRASRYRSRFPVEFDPSLEQSDWNETRREAHRGDCVDDLKIILGDNIADLSPVERNVLRHRFALGRGKSKRTLAQVGEIIGLTKERVRQIQNKALGKIRDIMEEEFLVR